MEKKMSAELGWVRVRAGRQDTYAYTILQTDVDSDGFMVAFMNVAAFHSSEGLPCSSDSMFASKIVFDALPESCIYTPDAIVVVAKEWVERRSVKTGSITHFIKKPGESFRVLGKHVGTVRVFRQNFCTRRCHWIPAPVHLKRPCVWPMTFLSGVHSSYRFTLRIASKH
jgi:hypothetical protein